MTVAAQFGRMRPWYDAIVDWVIANPGRPMSECAKALGRSQATLSLIINSDVFKLHLDKRRREFRERLDESIITKTTMVADKVLDLQLEALEKKRDKIPLATLNAMADSSLERLGYGVQKNGTHVNVNVGPNAGATIPVSKNALAEARQKLRAHEQKMIDITPDGNVKMNGNSGHEDRNSGRSGPGSGAEHQEVEASTPLGERHEDAPIDS